MRATSAVSVPRRLASLAALVLCALALTLALPRLAFAKSYECPSVNITAQAQTDGTLHVVEQRTFDFNGSFTAVWWTFEGLSQNAELAVNSLRMVQVDGDGNVIGEWQTLDETSFQIAWREEGGPGRAAWSFDRGESTVYAFFDQTDARVVFELDYSVENGVQAYDDVAEIYWKYVPEGWKVDSRNVSLTVELPVPMDATVVPGDNVRAWGHGPLDGVLSVNEDGTVSYEVPFVRAGQYAEARVVFPVKWLSNLSTKARLENQGTMRLDAVIAAEEAWADSANAQRLFSLSLYAALAAACVLVLAVALVLFFRYGREYKPDFTGDYWRDVPEADMQPAVVGRLWRWNRESSDDFTATIIHLANKGALCLRKGSYANAKGKTVDDYYLVRVDNVAAALTDPVERATIDVLFNVFSEGAPSLWFGTIRAFGERNPERYTEAMQTWQGVLSAEVNKRDFIELRSKRLQVAVVVAAALFFLGGIAAALALSNLIALAFMLPTGIALAFIANYMPRRTEYGNNIAARAKALRNWLRDFSSLDERPPTDVRVWGEFMVYAYLFGLADQAIRELRTAVPELFESAGSDVGISGWVPWYVWYAAANVRGHGHLGDAGSASAIDLFDASVANTLASAQAALSQASNASGVGGGFSMGGGGGFGGGGGAR